MLLVHCILIYTAKNFTSLWKFVLKKNVKNLICSMNVGHWWPHVAVQFFKKSKVARFVCIVSSRISASEEKLFMQCVKGKLSRDARSIKGMTINDLGAEEIFEMNLFFPGNLFRINIFPWQGLSNCFFPGECLSKFIFSWRVPLKIYFFPGECLSKFFSPGECLSKFMFFWRRASKIFFSRFPPAPAPDH